MSDKPKSVNFSLDDDDDLQSFAPKAKSNEPTAAQVAAATTKSFVSRENSSDKPKAESVKETAKRPRKTTRKRPVSPYKEQLNVKCRARTKAEFQKLAESRGVYDYQLFEEMIATFKASVET